MNMDCRLAIALRDEISEKHRQCCALDDELREIFLKKLNATRAVGELLGTAKHQMGEARFDEFKKSLPIDSAALRQYIRFARQHPSPFDDFREGIKATRDACTITGLLPAPQGGACGQLQELSFFSDWSRRVQQLALLFAKYSNQKPLPDWRTDEADQFLRSCRPVFDIARKVQLVSERV
jgi:hypothetical protein